MQVLQLGRLRDVTRFLDSDIRNEAFLCTEKAFIKCNGILLAARSKHLENIILGSEKVPAIEFTDNLDGLNVCLDLIYGKRILVNKENYRSIFKFGKLFEINEMIEGILKWVVKSMPLDLFWEVYLDIASFQVPATEKAFKAIAKKYHRLYNLLQGAKEVCLRNDKTCIIATLKLLSDTSDISCDEFVEFVLSVLKTTPVIQPDTPDSKDMSYSPFGWKVDISNELVSFGVTCIENGFKDPEVFNLRHDYACNLEKLSDLCNDLKILRRINKIQSDLLTYKIPEIITSHGISWELVRRLTTPTTSLDDILSFVKNAPKAVHPAIICEIFLKWSSCNTEWGYSKMNIVETFIRDTQECDSMWATEIKRDLRFKEAFRYLDDSRVGKPLYLYLVLKGRMLKALIKCIKDGTGEEVALSKEYMYSSQVMKKYKSTIDKFQYNSEKFPPYERGGGHWYLICSSANVFTYASFIVDSQHDIVHYLESSQEVFLYFMPSPILVLDSDTKKRRNLNLKAGSSLGVNENQRFYRMSQNKNMLRSLYNYFEDL